MSSITIVDIPRISRENLAQIIKDKHASMAVIDVRDSDYIGGHIVGGTNVPSSTHDYKMPELVRELKDKETVVFHCALSQQRGPGAALKYLRERERLLPKKGKEGDVKMVEEVEGQKAPEIKGQTVYILDGGFVKWQEVYGEDKELTEDYQKDIWEFGY